MFGKINKYLVLKADFNCKLMFCKINFILPNIYFSKLYSSDHLGWDYQKYIGCLSVRELDNIAQSAFITFVFFPSSTESRCAFELQPIFGQFSQFIDSDSDQVRGSTSDLEIFSVL